MSNNLYYTIGLPRSGKSTLAQKWLKFEYYIENGIFVKYDTLLHSILGSIESTREKYDREKQSRTVVSGDAIRESLGNLWNPDVENYVDAIKFTMVKALLKTGHTVLIDETNTSERSIRKILELDIGAQVVVVPTSKEECLKRAKPELHKPIERMWDNICSVICQDCEYISDGNQIILKPEYVVSAIKGIREELILHKKNYTNEPIRDTTAKNPELPKVSPLSKPSGADETCCWSYTSPIVPEPGFQVY